MKTMFKELRLIRGFLARSPGSFDALVGYFENRVSALRRTGGRGYSGLFGHVRVCDDIYGYEVKLGLGPSAQLLDCCPAYYGLTAAQADRLYTAILSCVPGSCAYASKQVRQSRMIGGVSA